MYSNEDKIKIFSESLSKFETEHMRLYCEDMIKTIPDYIFEIPSSTSLKYHNKTQCQKHGQIYHIVMFEAIMNYILSLKCIKEKFPTPEIRDAMRCIAYFHDSQKCGSNGSQFTVHEHPILAGQWVRETKVEHDIDDKIKEQIACMCERHSGEFISSKRSKVILPEPETEAEILCHMCDILSSRADIDMQPSDYLKSVFGEEKVELPNIDDYIISFGKHKGEKLIDVFRTDHDYCMWLKENSYQKEIVNMIKQLESQEDDEI